MPPSRAGLLLPTPPQRLPRPHGGKGDGRAAPPPPPSTCFAGRGASPLLTPALDHSFNKQLARTLGRGSPGGQPGVNWVTSRSSPGSPSPKPPSSAPHPLLGSTAHRTPAGEAMARAGVLGTPSPAASARPASPGCSRLAHCPAGLSQGPLEGAQPRPSPAPHASPFVVTARGASVRPCPRLAGPPTDDEAGVPGGRPPLCMPV